MPKPMSQSQNLPILPFYLKICIFCFVSSKLVFFLVFLWVFFFFLKIKFPFCVYPNLNLFYFSRQFNMSFFFLPASHTKMGQKFCNISVHASLGHVYHVSKADKVMEDIHWGWWYSSSWWTDMLCITSLLVWFESCKFTNLCFMNSN